MTTVDEPAWMAEAVEAAWQHAFPGLPLGITIEESRRRIEAAVRAAAPIIRRAVLEEAAADIEKIARRMGAERAAVAAWLREWAKGGSDGTA